MKYRRVFPQRFDDLDHADQIDRDRDATLDVARHTHPERFGNRVQARPKILHRDPAAWINRPSADDI